MTTRCEILATEAMNHGEHGQVMSVKRLEIGMCTELGDNDKVDMGPQLESGALIKSIVWWVSVVVLAR